MVIWVVEFSIFDKFQRFLAKNQYLQRKLLYFVNWHSLESSKIGHHFRKKSVSKIDLKVRFWLFLTTHHYVNSQTKIISFEDVDFWLKTFWICIPPLKTRQPILPCLHVSGLSCKGWQSGWWRKGQDQTHFQRKYCQGKGFSVVEFQVT